MCKIGPLWDLNETLISEESLHGSYNYPPLSYLLMIISLLFLCLDLFEWTWRKGSSKSDICLYTEWGGAPYGPPNGHCWNLFFHYLWLGADEYYTVYIRYREKGVERASNGTGPTTREPAFSVLWLIVPFVKGWLPVLYFLCFLYQLPESRCPKCQSCSGSEQGRPDSEEDSLPAYLENLNNCLSEWTEHLFKGV